MKLLRLLDRLERRPLHLLVVAAAGSALGSTLTLAIVNKAAEHISEARQDFVELPLAAAFIAAVIFYMSSDIWLVSRMAVAVETVIDSMRMRLLDHLRRCDLLKLESFGQTALFDSITQASQAISQNSHFLALSLRSALLTVAILIYIATISLTAFALIGVLLAVGAVIYFQRGRDLEDEGRRMAEEEAGLFESVSDLFDGFKEQRLDSAHSLALNQTFSAMSERTLAARNLVHRINWGQFVFGETAFNLMLGVVIFAVPRYSSTFAEEIAKISTAVLFMSSPVFALMQSLASMRAAEHAAGRMLELEERITGLVGPDGAVAAQPVPPDFSVLRMDGVSFAFPAAEGEIPFRVGPFDLTIKRGETVFVTGGNGSGKSTFIKLLTGLYHPQDGQILLDDMVIEPPALPAYRELMATIFADFHLFARLYGMAVPDAQEADGLMRQLEMSTVTSINGDHFERTELSAGQRKRLALAAARLEHKPILILDEWAADQDPHFRQRFYREIIPELKAMGLTIIAVTHDDHYFDVADRRYHMEDGRLSDPTAANLVNTP